MHSSQSVRKPGAPDRKIALRTFCKSTALLMWGHSTVFWFSSRESEDEPSSSLPVDVNVFGGTDRNVEQDDDDVAVSGILFVY